MKNSIKIALVMFFALTSTGLFAQYGFGTNSPNPNSAMDIVSPNKGVLIPRISLTASSTFLLGATATASHTSMLIFNTSSSTLNGLRGAGYYYWTTTTAPNGFWTRISNGPSLTESATLHDTLRWDGTNWVNSSALQNDDVNVTATGSLTVAGNIYADTFTTIWTPTPPAPYAVNDVVLHEGRFYRNVDAATASTTPSGTTAPNVNTWEPISSAPQTLAVNQIGATATATSTTTSLTISEGNAISLVASNGLHFSTQGTTNTLELIATNELTGVLSTTGAGLTSETLTLTLANDITGPDIFDLSTFEEVKAGTGTPSTQTFTPSPTTGDLYVDTNSSTLWTFVGPAATDWVLVETAVENIYTDNGTLTASRTVNLDGKSLQFADTASSVLYLDSADDRVYVGNNTSFTGTASYTASHSGTLADLDLVVEGDTKTRFLVDENDEVGNTGDVLTRTDTGMEWKPSGSLLVEMITTSQAIGASVPYTPGIVLISPAGADVTATLPAANSADYPIGSILKIKRNGDYSTPNNEIYLNASGANASIDGNSNAALSIMGMGYASVDLISTASGWVRIY